MEVIEMNRRVQILSAVLALAWSGPLSAAVVLEVESRDHRVSPPQTQSSQVISDGRQLAMGIMRGRTNSDGGMIYRGGRREMLLVNHRDQSYMVFDRETIEQLTGQLNQAMGQMQETLKNVPPDQRALMEQTMKDRMPAQQAAQRSPDVVRRTNDRNTVFGYAAVRYEVWRGGRTVRELWVTDWRNIEGGQEVAALFVEMGGFLEEMTSSIPGSGASPAGGLQNSIFTVMNEIDGFPVGVRDYREDGTIESESALRSARLQRLDPSAFEPPAGYRRQEMLGGGRIMGR
jgi:hypothetical protein